MRGFFYIYGMVELKLVTRGVFLLYFVSLFLGPLTETLDWNTWKLLVFSVINTIAFGYFLVSKDLRGLMNKAIKSKVSLVTSLFIAWALLSYFYALNPTEVIVRIFTMVNFYLLFLNLSVIFAYNKFTKIQISLIISFFFLLQVSISYWSYLNFIDYKAYTFDDNQFLISIFSNRNITTALFLVQIPFAMYLILKSKSLFIRSLSIILFTSSFFILFLLASRTSYVIMLGLFFLFLFSSIFYKHTLKNFFNKPLGLFISILVLTYVLSLFALGTDNTANAVNRIQTIDFEETSTNTRLRYYSYAFDEIISNPLIGVGYGNWKIVSIERDKENILSYVVPYTMHNDFLEVAVELGLIGLLLFLLIFLIPLYKLVKYVLNKESIFAILLLSSLMVYMIDANLNFPSIRMSSLFYCALLISMSNNFKQFK
jgi:O-antigen ligase